ncbi:MAG: sigma 54-interacting transcriptional regulator [Planctomycetaceae bacterium]
MAKRSPGKSTFERILRNVTTPVFLIAAGRKIAFFNAGCESLTGWTAAEIVGKTCDYAAADDTAEPESLASNLAPPPEVFAGLPADVPAYLPHRSGEALPQLLRFQPLVDIEGNLQGVLGFILPIPAPAHAADTTPSRKLHAELSALRLGLRQRFGFRTLVCKSAAMLRVLDQISVARASNSAVLLRGEKGTGKEHIARLIHYESESRHRSFMPLDCRRLSSLELKQALRRFLESGRIEDHGSPGSQGLKPGTVFLANADQLARDLQQTMVEAFGPGRPERRADLRLIGSTTSDFKAALDDETILPDFYFLLTTLEIALPPLRRRSEDLPFLAQSILEDLNRGDAKQVGGFAENVWKRLYEYQWPGNVDELRLVVTEARAGCKETTIRTEDLPFRFRTGLEAQSVGPPVKPRITPLEDLLARIEKEQIERTLAETRHNKSKAAELLGLTRPKLYRRMEALGIEDREGTP